MHKGFKKGAFIALTACLLLSYTELQAQDDSERLNAIETAVPFLGISPDSRAGAMGDAGVASSPDVSSQHWNVGKYAMIESDGGVAVSYTPWLTALNISDINLAYLSGFYRIDKQQVLSASLRYFSMGSITFTGITGELEGTYYPNEFAVDLGYSRLFTDHFSGGLAFRYTRSDLQTSGSTLGEDTYPGNSFAADLGFYYEHDVRVGDYDAEWAAGASITNIGTPMSYSADAETTPIPTNLRLGGRFTINLDDYNKISGLLDLNKLLVPTPPIMEENEDGELVVVSGKEKPESTVGGMIQSFYDAPGYNDGTGVYVGKFAEEMHEITYSAGVEYMYREQFAIRAGYFHEHSTKGNRKYFTLGVGLSLNVFNIDFAYLVPTAGRTSPLANTMRFTLGFNFADMKL